MEKGIPHCKLPVVLALINAGKVRATASAFGGARGLGINDLAGMCEVVMSLTTADFYKSMTTHADHRVWQDVYHGQYNGAALYIKFQRAGDYFVVSFKEL